MPGILTLLILIAVIIIDFKIRNTKECKDETNCLRVNCKPGLVFSTSVLTNYHKLGGLNRHKFTTLVIWRLRVEAVSRPCPVCRGHLHPLVFGLPPPSQSQATLSQSSLCPLSGSPSTFRALVIAGAHSDNPG